MSGKPRNTADRRFGQRVDYPKEIARLDALSRTRALSDVESLLLERFLMRVERKRVSYGNSKELARLGIERRQADRGARA